MRQLIKEFVACVVDSIPLQAPIYEFGAFQTPGQEEFADLRYLFPNVEYYGCDMREGPGVDKILDLHDIDMPGESIGTVLCLDTLEHVEFPHTALREMYRVLKPNGVVIISSVMKFPIHEFPSDYWRFTPEGFRSLLQPFSSSFVGYAGDSDFPHTVVGVAFKGVASDLEILKNSLGNWQIQQRRTQNNDEKFSIRRAVKLFIPPILLHIKMLLCKKSFQLASQCLSKRWGKPQ